MFPELRHAWRLLKSAVLIVGVLLSGVAAIEVLRAYVTLREVHPWLGYGFAGTCVAVIVGLGAYLYVRIGSRPRVLIPPKIDDPTEATERELDLYWTYLMQYLGRLTANPRLPEEDRTVADQKRQTLEREAMEASGREACIEMIRRAEQESIDPLLHRLDDLAEEEIRGCVRDVMLAVTLSPFRAVDLLVVLYRNAAMVVNVIGVYNSRPLLREQFLIFRDTLRVVAAVNFLSFGEKFTEQVFSRVPFLGPVMDDLIQGVGAGFLTSATGHAAKHRCRAFRGWNQNEARQHMTGMMADFLADTRDLFLKDVLPRLKPRLSAMDAWDKVGGAFTGAFEMTGEIMDTFVTRPVAAGGNAAASAGKATLNGVKIVGEQAVKFPVRGVRAFGRAVKNGASGTTSSIKRLFGGR